jgi:hypothetical protein
VGQAESALTDEVEKKAEELRQKILSSAPKTYFPQHAVQIENFASPYKFSEEEIQFVDHRKERKHRRNAAIGESVLTCFVIGLFFIGIYKGKSFLQAGKQSPSSEATQLNSSDVHAAQKTKRVTPQTFLVPDSTQSNDSIEVATLPKTRATTVKKNLPDSLYSKPAGTTHNIITQSNEGKKEEKKDENKTETAITVPEEIPVKKVILPVVKESPANDVKVEEEKKGFLKGIFRKKKKEDPQNDKKQEKNQ